MEDLKLEGMIDVDLGFGEIIKVRANGIKYIEIDSDYVFTIHYDNGTTQKVPTIYKDFSEILNQIKAQNSKGDEFMKNSKSVMDSVSNSASAADASAKNAAQSASAAAESAKNAMSSTPDGYSTLASTFNALGLYVDSEGYMCQATNGETQD